MIFVKTWSVVLFLLAIVMSACTDRSTTSSNEQTDESEISITQTAMNYGQDTSEQVERLLAKEHEFNEIIAVNSDEWIVIAIDPKHHDRFRLKDLRKSLKDTVEQSFKNYEIELSTDLKIILELRELKLQLNEQNITKEDLQKELERIQKLANEQT